MSLDWEELEALHEEGIKANQVQAVRKDRHRKMFKFVFTFILPLVLAGFVFFEGTHITKTLLDTPTMTNLLWALFVWPITLGLTAAIVAGVFTYATYRLENPPDGAHKHP